MFLEDTANVSLGRGFSQNCYRCHLHSGGTVGSGSLLGSIQVQTGRAYDQFRVKEIFTHSSQSHGQSVSLFSI